jgi:hypothetical protein
MSCLIRHAALCCLAFGVITLSACSPTATDISPDLSGDFANTAGLTYALAGDHQVLYAVSLNAGVWKFTDVDHTWRQLRDSPRYAMSIAVDPADSSHVVVGERNGDAQPIALNDAGVWESRDAGESWRYVLNPLSAPGGCASQAIPSVAFTARSTVIVATACGIARRPVGSTGPIRAQRLGFFFPAMPPGFQLITALAAAPNRIWARRADGGLMSSTDDGVTWNAMVAPPANVRFPQRGEPFSLGGFDGAAFMPSDVPGQTDDRRCGLLVYRDSTQDWQVIELHDETGDTCGTAPNYVAGRTSLRSFTAASGRQMLIYNTGQYVMRLDPNADFSAFETHKLLADSLTSSAGPPPLEARFGNQEYIHPDLWDFLVDVDADVYWVAGDGGVYENRPDRKWSGINNGLHTQHVQAMDVLAGAGNTRIIYATQDNDGWYGTPATSTWKHTGIGDANWTSADDAAGDFGQISRAPTATELVHFATNNTVYVHHLGPPCADGPQFLQFIQTLPSETPTGLDAVILVRRPCLDQGNPVTFAPALQSLGQPGPPTVIRNRSWSASPDFGTGDGWEIMANDLPAGANTVFVSMGHQSPHLYVQSTESGGEVLYQRRRNPLVRGWEPIFSGIIGRASCAYGLYGWYVPVYVNPYDDQRMLVLTSSGIQTRSSGSFAPDPVLTALLTDSGTYPLTDAFCGANTGLENAVAFPLVARMLGTPTLGRSAFLASGARVVSSPFTGTFYDRGDGIWRSVNYLLPKPATPTFAAGLDARSAYIALAGRGIVQVDRPNEAKIATYILPLRGFKPALGGGQFIFGELHGAEGSVLAGRHVNIRITAPDGTVKSDAATYPTDSDGRVLGLFVFAGDMVHLSFPGDDDYAPAETHYIR